MSWKGQPGLIASWPTLVWPWNMIWNIYVAGMHFQNSSTALILTLRCKNSFAETLKEPQTTGLVPVFFVSLSKSKREIIIISQFDCFPSAARGDTEKKRHFYNRWLCQSAGPNVSTEAGNRQLCHFIICQLLSFCFNIIYFLTAAFLQPSFPLQSRIELLLWNIARNQAKM